MASSSHDAHVDSSPDSDDETIPIPPNLRFTLYSLKLLIQTPLTSDNYLCWSTQVRSFLKATQYSKYLYPNTPIPPPFLSTPEGHRIQNPRFPKHNFINQTLLGALHATISPSLQSLILRHESVADLWNTLESHFQSHTRSCLLQLKAELHSLKMGGQDLPTYIQCVRSLYDQLEAVGSHTDDEDLIILTMKGLPPQFNALSPHLASSPKKYP